MFCSSFSYWTGLGIQLPLIAHCQGQPSAVGNERQLFLLANIGPETNVHNNNVQRNQVVLN